jgi:hypothetical protein
VGITLISSKALREQLNTIRALHLILAQIQRKKEPVEEQHNTNTSGLKLSPQIENKMAITYDIIEDFKYQIKAKGAACSENASFDKRAYASNRILPIMLI